MQYATRQIFIGLAHLAVPPQQPNWIAPIADASVVLVHSFANDRAMSSRNLD
jgi:hypothetical protein